MKHLFPLLIVLLLVSSSYVGVSNQPEELKTDKIEIVEAISHGTLAYWKFDEGTGNIAYDYTGHGFDGTIYGATWTTGYSSYALDFNGVDTYVDLDTHAPGLEGLGFNKGDEYFISAWVKTESTSPGVVYCISHIVSSLVYADIAMDSNGAFIFRVGTEECTLTLTSAPGYNDGEWHFVDCRWIGATVNPTMELWVDEALEDTLTEWQCPFNADDFEKAKIGRKSGDDVAPDYFDGIIDEVMIYRGCCPPPPPKPILTGANEVKMGEEYTLTIQTTWHDFSLKYNIAWGDGDVEWTELYNPAVIVQVKHVYNKRANATIEVFSQDEFGYDSEEATKLITVPKNHNPIWWLNSLLDRFPLLSRLLEWVMW